LLDLLGHPDVSLRRLVEGYSMEFAPEIGVPALEAVVARAGLEGLERWGAEAKLKAWRDGELKKSPDVPYRSRPTLAEADRWPPVTQDAVEAMMNGPSRLDAIAPALAEAFRKAPLEKRRHFAVRAIESTIADVAPGQTHEDDVAIEEAQYALRFEKLPAEDERARMSVLASRLEDEAALLGADPDQDKRGLAVPFRSAAHAVSALALALTGDVTRLDEALREAIAAESQMDSFIPFLEKMLRG
jgi:hypothetical protein